MDRISTLPVPCFLPWPRKPQLRAPSNPRDSRKFDRKASFDSRPVSSAIYRFICFDDFFGLEIPSFCLNTW